MTTAMLWKILDWTWIASEVIILAATRTRHSSGNVRDRGSLLILWPVIVASITAGSWIGEAHAPTMFGGVHWVRTASLAVLVIGLAIRWTAIVTLGRAFSANVAIHATQTVRKTGLFRFVRHPSYSGLVLIFVAVGMHTRNWVALQSRSFQPLPLFFTASMSRRPPFDKPSARNMSTTAGQPSASSPGSTDRRPYPALVDKKWRLPWSKTVAFLRSACRLS